MIRLVISSLTEAVIRTILVLRFWQHVCFNELNISLVIWMIINYLKWIASSCEFSVLWNVLHTAPSKLKHKMQN